MWKFFESLVEPFPKEEGGEIPPKNFIKFILFYTNGIWKYLFIVSFLSALVAVGEALFFYFMGLFVDVLTNANPKTIWQDNASLFISFIVLVLLLLPIFSLLHHLVLNQSVRSNSAMQIRYRIHRYLLRHSVSFFANDYAGRLSQKVMQTSMAVRDSVIKFTSVIMHMLVYFVTMMWMLAECHLYLVLVMLLWLIGYVYIMWYFIPKLRNQSIISAEKRSSMVGCIVDSYANIQTVKLFSRNNHEEEYAKGFMGESLTADYKLMRLVTKFDIYVQLINYALIAFLVMLSVLLWSKGIVLVGAIALAFGLSIRINNLSQWVMWEVGVLFDNIGNVQNGMETITKDITVKDPVNPAKIAVNEIKGDIVFNDVEFGYNDKVKVFSDLNLHIKPGERVGIVGHSGGGKSTLVNLLLRFYDVQGGSITLDGVDIRDYSQEDLRKAIAMVTQDTSLLHRSIKENILYGYELLANDNSDTLVEMAAKDAKALDFIQKLSDIKGNQGFATQVGERGVRLSGGQRQRIALARVILKNAPILILDEATSALDSEVEAAVKENLDKLMLNKTVIAIAHRLSTIAAMDRLIVLKDGRIVEQGTHKELLQLEGIYASLWRKQTDGFIGY